MQKEKILITGGAGYLGNVFIRHFLDKGYYITTLDNLLYNQDFPGEDIADNSNFNFIKDDVRNSALLKEIIPKYDIIFPLAGIVGMPACDKKPKDAVEINRDAIILLNKIRSNNQKLVCPITNSGYGTKSGEIYCTEETPLEPISLYGITKIEAEKHLLESEKDAITLRLATVFGMSQRMRTDLLVNDFVLTALTDHKITIYEKDFKRNYAHIKDIARAFEHCINNYDLMKNQPYNIGLDNANLSKADLAEKIKEYIPKFEVTYDEIGKDPDKRNYIVSNEKIKKTGFKPIYTLDMGIKELIAGYNGLIKRVLRKTPYNNL